MFIGVRITSGDVQLRRILTACLLSAACLGAARAEKTTTYRLTPEVAGGVLQDLKLELSFTGDFDGSTKVELPSKWSGSDGLWEAFHEIQAEGAKLRMAGPSTVMLTHRPGAAVTVSFKIRQDFEGPISVLNGTPFRPATQAKWFTAVGWTLFPEVDGRPNDPVAFQWGQAPEGWGMASDLDHRPVRARRIEDLLDAVVVGGERLKVVERQAAGGRIRIAYQAGKWGFDPEKLADLQGRIAETSSDFWKDRGEEFFVSVTPLVAPDDGVVQYGVGLGDAFSLWATENVDEPSLRHILAHEHQHAWFPNRVGGVRGGPEEPLDYWLSEGFTDFYTLRILLRSGVWTLEDFTADYNRILKAYSASPVRDAPNALVAAKFWEDRSVADLPYQRGLVVAALWDDRLRRATRGARDLDDVVLDMRDRANGPLPMRDAIGNLKASYRSLGGGSLDDDMKKLVDGGRRVMLPADLFGDCAAIRTYDRAAFDRGFDPALTSKANGVVGGVDPQGPAFAAGLRNGMRILKREAGDNEDSSVDLVYRVQDERGERLIRYKPQSRRTVTYQEIVLAPGMDAAKRARCARTMGGL
jgi:predicted metalloprotease with PDZ domain